ncbi:MAG: ABC transporter ATP-binding protein [Pseudomonadota bacterium]
MAGLILRGVGKSFDGAQVLSDVNLDVADGEFAVFVGPSGCGKSTLLRTIAGLEEVDCGEIRIDDVDVTGMAPANRGIAMVFQTYALYPHMTVYENMAFGMKIAGARHEEIDRAVRAAAETLGLSDLLDRKPKALSGGERQRTAIGRAIVRKPKIFLFDEPLSNLDAALRVRMRREFARLHEELKTTMIYVTHDQVEAMTLADRIIVLRRGRVEQIGSPRDLYDHPANIFVAGFIGSPAMNFFEGEIVRLEPDGVRVRIRGGSEIRAEIDASGAAIGAPATIGVRPEHLAIGGGENRIDAVIDMVEGLGGHTLVYLKTRGADEGAALQAPGDIGARKGDALSLSLPARHCHVFDPEGRAYPRFMRSPIAAFHSVCAPPRSDD